MKKFGKALVAAMCAAIVTCACGSSPSTGGAPAASAQKASGTTGKLVLYTSETQTFIAGFLAGFKKAYPGIKVQVYRSGTEQVLSRFMLEAQAGTPKADVLFLADAPTYQMLADKGLLASYASPELSGIPSKFVDPRHRFTGTKLIGDVIAYNTSDPKPKATWKFLLSPQARDKVVMPSPLYSGVAAHFVDVMSTEPFAGWNFFKKLKANGVQVVQGNGDVLKEVASGAKAYGILVDANAVVGKESGSPLGYVYPVEGTPAVVEPVAIAKGARDLGPAKTFVNFVLSKAGQVLAAKAGSYMPIRKGVAAPKGYPPRSEIKYLEISPQKALQIQAGAKKRFAALFNLPT